jgi:hypothetical protein
MRERPIIFSGPMVRAVTRLEDPKTQTRRPVTGAALEWCDQFVSEFICDPKNGLSPYGYPGDRLWVRETTFFCNGDDSWLYRADGVDLRKDVGTLFTNRLKWTPSIHMPRKACRLHLEVTGLRVERLLAISVDDCFCTTCSSTSSSGDRLFPGRGAEEDQAGRSGARAYTFAGADGNILMDLGRTTHGSKIHNRRRKPAGDRIQLYFRFQGRSAARRSTRSPPPRTSPTRSAWSRHRGAHPARPLHLRGPRQGIPGLQGARALLPEPTSRAPKTGHARVRRALARHEGQALALDARAATSGC